MPAKRVALPLRKQAGPRQIIDQCERVFPEYNLHVNKFAGQPWRPELGEVLLVLGNVNFYPEVKDQLLKEDRSRLPKVVVWHTEPLPLPRSSGVPLPWLDHREIAKILLRDPRATDPYTNFFLLRRLHRKGLPHRLLVSTLERAEFLAEQGIRAEHLPLGYSPDHGRDLGLERDIDVLLLGARTLRRQMIVAYLRARGVRVTWVGDWGPKGFWGERRTQLLNRVKIFLNIPRFRSQFTQQRFVLGAANKCLIVSEPLYKPTPFVPGQHYVESSYTEMPEVIRYYLEHEQERRGIAGRAYRLVIEKCRLEDSIGRLARAIAELAENSRVQ